MRSIGYLLPMFTKAAQRQSGQILCSTSYSVGVQLNLRTTSVPAALQWDLLFICAGEKKNPVLCQFSSIGSAEWAVWYRSDTCDVLASSRHRPEPPFATSALPSSAHPSANALCPSRRLHHKYPLPQAAGREEGAGEREQEAAVDFTRSRRPVPGPWAALPGRAAAAAPEPGGPGPRSGKTLHPADREGDWGRPASPPVSRPRRPPSPPLSCPRRGGKRGHLRGAPAEGGALSALWLVDVAVTQSKTGKVWLLGCGPASPAALIGHRRVCWSLLPGRFPSSWSRCGALEGIVLPPPESTSEGWGLCPLQPPSRVEQRPAPRRCLAAPRPWRGAGPCERLPPPQGPETPGCLQGARVPAPRSMGAEARNCPSSSALMQKLCGLWEH